MNRLHLQSYLRSDVSQQLPLLLNFNNGVKRDGLCEHGKPFKHPLSEESGGRFTGCYGSSFNVTRFQLAVEAAPVRLQARRSFVKMGLAARAVCVPSLMHFALCVPPGF